MVACSSEPIVSARLHVSSRILGLEYPTTTQYGLQPRALKAAPRTLFDILSGDIFLLVLERLEHDRDKCACACACRDFRAEQRRLCPPTSYRPRMSLALLVGARAAGWSVVHCHVDKKAGKWTPVNEMDSLLGGLETLSVVGRPDCALLVLSPFTDLAAMTTLRVFELDACAIGDAGVAVLSAAFRQRALPALQVLDLRRNQVTDGGARVLAETLADASDEGAPNGAALPKLTTLGLDRNAIGSNGLTSLARAVTLGAFGALRSLFVDRPDHEALKEACEKRCVELSSW